MSTLKLWYCHSMNITDEYKQYFDYFDEAVGKVLNAHVKLPEQHYTVLFIDWFISYIASHLKLLSGAL